MKIILYIFILLISIFYSCKKDNLSELSCENCNVEITNTFIKKNLKEIVNYYKYNRIPPYDCTVEIRRYKTEKKYYFKNGLPFKNQEIIGYLEVDSVKFYIADTIDNSFKILKPISKEFKIKKLGFTYDETKGMLYEPLNFIFNIKNNKIDSSQKLTMGY
jgi:hypothetical protein